MSDAQEYDQLTLDHVHHFWAWFSENANRFATALQEGSEVDHRQLSERVKALNSGLVWEFGPGLIETYGFVVSPGGVRSLLPVTRLVVQHAPSIQGWEFHSAKPPKEWTARTLRLSSKTEAQVVEVDLDRWRYSLVAFNNYEFFDVTFVTPESLTLSAELQRQAAWLLLDGEFGEELAIERFGKVDVVDAKNWARDTPTGEVSRMREHLETLAKGPESGS